MDRASPGMNSWSIRFGAAGSSIRSYSSSASRGPRASATLTALARRRRILGSMLLITTGKPSSSAWLCICSREVGKRASGVGIPARRHSSCSLALSLSARARPAGCAGRRNASFRWARLSATNRAATSSAAMSSGRPPIRAASARSISRTARPPDPGGGDAVQPATYRLRTGGACRSRVARCTRTPRRPSERAIASVPCCNRSDVSLKTTTGVEASTPSPTELAPLKTVRWRPSARPARLHAPRRCRRCRSRAPG
jgi:hypothetical protein